MGALLRWARPRARIVTVDPHYEHVAGGMERWRRVLPLVDAFLPSRQEAIDLLGTWSDGEVAARELVRLGAPLVCVKLGAEGAVAYRRGDDGPVHVPSTVRDPVDATGCGDAFSGGFLVGLAEQGDPRMALAYGAVSASFAAEGYGAAHALTVDRAEARRRLAALLDDQSRLTSRTRSSPEPS